MLKKRTRSTSYRKVPPKKRFTRSRIPKGAELKFKNMHLAMDGSDITGTTSRRPIWISSTNASALTVAGQRGWYRLANLVGLTRATGPEERIGDTVTLRSIRLRFQIQAWLTAQGYGNCTARVLILLDRSPNGFTENAGYGPGIDQIFQEGGDYLNLATAQGSNGFWSELNQSRLKRFKVLRECIVNLRSSDNAKDAATTPTANNTARMVGDVDCYVKCNIPIEYLETSGTASVTNLGSNAVYILVNVDRQSIENTQAGTDVVTWYPSGFCMLKYTDY